MKVENVEVCGLESSIIASGYPMRTEAIMREVEENDMNRAKKLSKAGNAHEQYLTGIIVNFDLTCTNKMWVEAERYRFLSFVSSQSTMHRIAKFDLRPQYNEYVDKRIIDIMEELKDTYNKTNDPKDYLKLLYSNPAGFELTARMTTNYRCLKNIYYQRKSHRLPEWREFCNWILTLPKFKEICIGEK